MLSHAGKKILLITYYYPPSTAIGGMRIASFAKYLPESGWEPYILTVKDCYIEHKDEARLDPTLPWSVYTSGKWLSLNDMYLKIKSLLKKPAESSSRAANETFSPSTRKNKPVRRFIAALLAVPDEKRNWILPATYKALQIIREKQINCILTSSPPYSCHIIGMLVKLLNPEIKWVADFRDPWMVPLAKRSYPTTSFTRKIDYYLEKQVLSRANLVLTTTEILAKTLGDYYSDTSKEKYHLVPNGYDASAVFSQAIPKYRTFTVSYTGAFYVGRSPEPLFKAVSSMIKQGKINGSDISIKLVGQCRNVEGEPTANIASRYGLGSIVEILDAVPQSDAQIIIKQSHVALLLAPNQPYQIPAKTYEYIGLGTPILALTSEGATADLVNSVGGGISIHPDDVQAMEDFLVGVMSNGKGIEEGFNNTDQYSRMKSAQKLGRLIDNF